MLWWQKKIYEKIWFYDIDTTMDYCIDNIRVMITVFDCAVMILSNVVCGVSAHSKF
jgi:hypothetical protein